MSKSIDRPEEFPARLRAARDLRQLTQADLAEKAKMPSTSISHLEAGSRKPSFDNLRRLASALEVSTDYLLGRVEMENDYSPDTLYRDIQNLTESDREIIRSFAATLRGKQKPK